MSNVFLSDESIWRKIKRNESIDLCIFWVHFLLLFSTFIIKFIIFTNIMFFLLFIIIAIGNYQEYLKNKETPLREIEPTNVRQHMFGNPYKKDKHMVMVDEADLGEVMMKPNANPMAKKAAEVMNRSRKRKAGPIRKDYVFRRLSTNSYSSMSSNDSSDMDDSRSMSDTLSNISDSDENELTIDLGFNQPSVVEQDFMVNGHVQSFINGENSDEADDVIIQSSPPILTPSIGHQMNSSTLNAIPLAPQVLTNAPFNMNQPTPSTMPVQTAIIGISPSYTSPLLQQNGSQTTAPVQLHNQAHNDLNDAQEISKILQQCHNGASTNSGSSSSNISIIISHSNSISHGNSNSNGNGGILYEPIVSTSHLNQKTTNRSDRDTTTSRNDFEPPANLFAAVSHSPHNHLTNITDNSSITHKKHEVQSNACNIVNIEDDAHDRQENDEEFKESIRENNLKARKIIFQDIRRPGRDYSQLLEHLDLIKGNLETKLKFVQMCIEESQRFRRKKMADCIQEWWDKYVDRTNNFNSIEFAT